MRIRRIVNAQSAPDGSVVNSVEEVVADARALPSGSTNVYGIDAVPVLPVAPGEIEGPYTRMGIFAPMGGMRVNMIVLQPVGAPVNIEANLEKMDLGTGGGVVVHDSGDGMHRTDSIDMLVIMEGEVDVEGVNDDGLVSLTAGDLFIQNGCFHRWVNRSTEPCTVMAFVFPAERDE